MSSFPAFASSQSLPRPPSTTSSLGPELRRSLPPRPTRISTPGNEPPDNRSAPRPSDDLDLLDRADRGLLGDRAPSPDRSLDHEPAPPPVNEARSRPSPPSSWFHPGPGTQLVRAGAPAHHVRAAAAREDVGEVRADQRVVAVVPGDGDRAEVREGGSHDLREADAVVSSTGAHADLAQFRAGLRPTRRRGPVHDDLAACAPDRHRLSLRGPGDREDVVHDTGGRRSSRGGGQWRQHGGGQDRGQHDRTAHTATLGRQTAASTTARRTTPPSPIPRTGSAASHLGLGVRVVLVADIGRPDGLFHSRSASGSFPSTFAIARTCDCTDPQHDPM